MFVTECDYVRKSLNPDDVFQFIGICWNSRVVLEMLGLARSSGAFSEQHFLAVFDIDFNLFDDRISRQLGSLAG